MSVNKVGEVGDIISIRPPFKRAGGVKLGVLTNSNLEGWYRIRWADASYNNISNNNRSLTRNIGIT